MDPMHPRMSRMRACAYALAHNNALPPARALHGSVRCTTVFIQMARDPGRPHVGGRQLPCTCRRGRSESAVGGGRTFRWRVRLHERLLEPLQVQPATVRVCVRVQVCVRVYVCACRCIRSSYAVRCCRSSLHWMYLRRGGTVPNVTTLWQHRTSK
jgi:hypothetical protein